MVSTVLKSYRKSHFLTQKEMAARLSITREYYSRLERGVAAPSFALFEAMCSTTQSLLPHMLSHSDDGSSNNGVICTLCTQLGLQDRKEIERLMKRMLK